MNPYKLYLVTDEQQDVTTLIHVVREAVAGGVTMVQIREKHAGIRAFLERAQALKSVLQGSNVPLIINDRIDVALAIGADGVHLGQSDMPVEYARKLLGPDKILGLSIETNQQLIDVNQQPVDYIGLSAIFASKTKQDTTTEWGIDGLTATLRKTSLPVVAIGGINMSNIHDVAATGVHGVALVSAICHAQNPKLAAQLIHKSL